MKKSFLLALAILLFPALAHAQVSVRFGWTAPPPLVEVSPGVQVVEDSGDEVFFTNGHYWVERGGRWYWADDYREHWVPVGNRRVPLFLRNHHRGEYAHWRRAEHMRREENREIRHDEIRHEARAAEHREERHEEREHARAVHEGERRQERREEHREERREERERHE